MQKKHPLSYLTIKSKEPAKRSLEPPQTFKDSILKTTLAHMRSLRMLINHSLLLWRGQKCNKSQSQRKI